MLLNPTGKCDLEHRAYFLRGIAGKSAVAAASQEGHVSVFASDFTPLHRHRLAPKVEAVFPHPSQQLLAWVNGESGSLVVQSLAGHQVAEIRPPRWEKDASQWAKQGFDDCFFDESGKFLWVVGPTNDKEIELQLIDASDWSSVQKITVEDPFGASSCSLHRTGKPGLVSLWIAAGQDGQQVHWVKRRRSKFTCERADQLANTVPPVFSPDGSEFLVVNEDHAICRYDVATMKRLKTPLESEDEPFAESLCYLDNQHALASTGEGRIFLVDTYRMKLVDEVELEGHEPRPIGKYHPSLAKERGLGTDISWFTRLGKAVVFIYQRERGSGLKGWKDSLLWYLVK